jgi:hypothetical protein
MLPSSPPGTCGSVVQFHCKYTQPNWRVKTVSHVPCRYVARDFLSVLFRKTALRMRRGMGRGCPAQAPSIRRPGLSNIQDLHLHTRRDGGRCQQSCYWCVEEMHRNHYLCPHH